MKKMWKRMLASALVCMMMLQTVPTYSVGASNAQLEEVQQQEDVKEEAAEKQGSESAQKSEEEKEAPAQEGESEEQSETPANAEEESTSKEAVAEVAAVAGASVAEMAVASIAAVTFAEEPMKPEVYSQSSDKYIYANGVPIEISAGEVDGTSTVKYDGNGDGTYETTLDLDPSTEGIVEGELDLSGFTVFGGGFNNTVESSSITMTGGTVEEIYGGGRNIFVWDMVQGVDASAPSKIEGTATITISGGTTTAIYGGGMANHMSTGGTEVYSSVGSTNVVMTGGETDYVFGGGHAVTARSTAPVYGDTAVSITNAKIEEVFGGGHATGSNSVANVEGNTTLSLNGGSEFQYAFGGGWSEASGATANVEKNTKVTANNNNDNEGYIFGGGQVWNIENLTTKSAANVNGSTKVDIIESSYISGVYGGGYADIDTSSDIEALAIADVLGNTDINIENSTDIGMIVGGGDTWSGDGFNKAQTNVGKDETTGTKINVSHSEVTGNIYGGGSGYNSDNTVYGDTDVVINNSDVYGNVYGGATIERAGLALVTGNTNVEIHNQSKIEGEVFGGGGVVSYGGVDYMSTTEETNNNGRMVAPEEPSESEHIKNTGVTGDTNVSLMLNASNADVGSIYGGAEYGYVTANTNITIQAGEVKGNVYGGGTHYEPESWDKSNAEEDSLIDLSEIGYVGGNTNVAITGAEIDTVSDAMGDVYGGPHIGVVKGNTNVHLTNTGIEGSVFGGAHGGFYENVFEYNKAIWRETPQIGSVVGNTYITINTGTKIMENVYGGGNRETAVGGDSFIKMTAGSVTGNMFGGGLSSYLGYTLGDVTFDEEFGEYYRERAEVEGKGNTTIEVFGGNLGATGSETLSNIYGSGSIDLIQESEPKTRVASETSEEEQSEEDVMAEEKEMFERQISKVMPKNLGEVHIFVDDDVLFNGNVYKAIIGETTEYFDTFIEELEAFLSKQEGSVIPEELVDVFVEIIKESLVLVNGDATVIIEQTMEKEDVASTVEEHVGGVAAGQYNGPLAFLLIMQNAMSSSYMTSEEQPDSEEIDMETLIVLPAGTGLTDYNSESLHVLRLEQRPEDDVKASVLSGFNLDNELENFGDPKVREVILQEAGEKGAWVSPHWSIKGDINITEFANAGEIVIDFVKDQELFIPDDATLVADSYLQSAVTNGGYIITRKDDFAEKSNDDSNLSGVSDVAERIYRGDVTDTLTLTTAKTMYYKGDTVAEPITATPTGSEVAAFLTVGTKLSYGSTYTWEPVASTTNTTTPNLTLGSKTYTATVPFAPNFESVPSKAPAQAAEKMLVEGGEATGSIDIQVSDRTEGSFIITFKESTDKADPDILDTLTVEKGEVSEATTEDVPEVEGGEFIGWYQEDEEGNRTEFEFGKEMTTDVTLYPHYKYEVIFEEETDGNPGDEEYWEKDEVDQGEEPTLPTTNPTDPNGGEFDDWYVEDEEGNRKPFNPDESIEGPVTVYPHFKYTVTFELETTGTPEGKQPYDVMTDVKQNTTITDPTLGEGAVPPVDPKGGEFIGWYYEENGVRKEFDFDTKIDSNLVLYPHYKYDVVYETETEGTPEGEEPFHKETVDQGETPTLPDTTPTGPNGEDFGDWYVEDEEGNRTPFNPDEPIEGPTTVYPHFKYAVEVLDSEAENDGSGTYTQGVKVTIDAGTKDGYVFDMWIIEEAPSGFVIGQSTKSEFTMPDTKVILRATWKKTYDVTVNGSYSSNSGAGTYLPGDQVTVDAGSRNGYTFGGWTVTSPSGLVLGQTSSTSFTMPEGDVIITAIWNQNEGTTPGGGDGGTTPGGGDGGTTPGGGDGGTTPDEGDGGTTPDEGDEGTTPDEGDEGTTPDGGDDSEGGTNEDGGTDNEDNANGGDEDLVITPPTDEGDVSKVEVDDNELDEDDYTIDEDGNLIINPDYIATLEDGTHIIRLTIGEDTYEAELVVDGGVPLSMGVFDKVGGAWSLFDLIMTILTVVFAVAYTVIRPKKRDEEEDEEDGETEESKHKKRLVTSGVLALLAVFNIILFLVTQDLSQPMIIFDIYSIIFALVAIVQIVVMFFIRKKNNDDEAEEQNA